ncbi:MAG: LacI family DNA-binding transcriptional regulator [Pseudobutyrivibrio sp.]|nr:LacI family DNA-binding transcriptional regulator [Pseudobutyrivibrio sp.]
MKDVAVAAGVSLGTVSKVFNGIPVGAEYKNKVDAAAKMLGYQVNEYARGLRASKTNTIAVIVPNVIHPFYSTLADMCCNKLSEKGYRMLLATTSFDPQTEQQCIDMVQQNKVDGIIAITYNPELDVKEDIPFVIIDRKFHHRVPCVSSDNYAGGQLAAEKLVEKGCSNLLFLGISSHVPGEADKRNLGFASYCQTNNIKHTIHRVWDEDGFDDIKAFIDSSIKNGKFAYDGIFVSTDMLAIQVMDYLKKHDISIPEDVQVIGFDGIPKFGFDGYYCSTIKQPLDKMAATAIDILLNQEINSTPSLVCLPVEYCEGDTTK